MEELKKFLLEIKKEPSIIKKQYPNIYQQVIDVTSFLPLKEKFSKRRYHILNDILYLPVCETCKNKYNTWIGPTKGYTRFCSLNCARNNEDQKEKVKQTNFEKYGVENVAQIETSTKKSKQTRLETKAAPCK